MDTKWTTVEILRHARHDWLNKVQLIKGNMALGKTDRISAIVDEIISEARIDAKISNINMPLLAELMLTGNWNRYKFELTYEMEDDVTGHPEYDKIIAGWMESFFHFLDRSTNFCGDRHLKVQFSQSLNGELILRLTFQGQTSGVDQLLHELGIPAPLKIKTVSEKNDLFFIELIAQ